VAQQLYDTEPLLAVQQHPSAQALADKQRDGGKSVTLAECLEVGGWVGARGCSLLVATVIGWR
jgi:hypothetical protein